MKTQVIIYISILGFLFASKSASQTFTIDSIKIDEVNSQLSIYSKDLDFKNAKVYVTSVKLPAVQATNSGYIYRLPDSGDGSFGNVSIFAHGTIDSNWRITRLTVVTSTQATLKDSLYTLGTGPWSYPHIKRATYHLIFRTADHIPPTINNFRFHQLNRLSYTAWDFNDFMQLPNNYFEDYMGGGSIPADIKDSTNFVYFGHDSIFLSYAAINNLPCSYSYYHSARETGIIDSGQATPSLDRFYQALKLYDSISIIPGKTSLKKNWWIGFTDSLITETISWSNLGSEFYFVSPSSISAVSAVIDNTSALLENYPNPFALSTTIPFTLEEGTQISIDILDPLGRICTSLVKGYYDAGSHEVKFNTGNFPAGVYFIRMITANITFTQPMLITR